MIEISISGETRGAILSDKSIELLYTSKDNKHLKLELYGNQQHTIKVFMTDLLFDVKSECVN